jgi:hypothetical protein
MVIRPEGKHMDFQTKCNVVTGCWLSVREEDSWASVMKYGDIGFPLAYAHAFGLAVLTPDGEEFVSEVYEVIKVALGVNEDLSDFSSMLDNRQT